MKVPLPNNEAQRLASLRAYGVLDTGPEEAFDDLAMLAAHVCQVPIAMVSLVDEKRQWFKARIGMTATETPRDIAFCAHTILHADEVFEVRDAAGDPRFADSPLVTSEQRIRFYAGAPLVAPDGHTLGALCVMDREPRHLSAEQLAALRALSRGVVAQLELRRQSRAIAEKERETANLLATADKSRRALLSLLEDQRQVETALRSSEERFRQIAENIQEVFWMTDAARSEMLYVSPAFETIWGRTRDSLQTSAQAWVDSIHADDRQRVQLSATANQALGKYDETYRVVRPDGTERWVRDRAFPIKNEQGVVHRIVGVTEDITQRKAVELRVELQHTVTRVLAEGASLPQTARNLLEAICRAMDWEVGGFWMVDRPSKSLRCVEIWDSAPAKFGTFVNASRVALFPSGAGLPGKVWASGIPVWIPEVGQDSSFKRSEAANEVGLRGGVGFPIKLRGEVLGVVDFFSTKSRAPDPEVLALFDGLGAQLGQFIERQQLADQFRQAQKMEAIGTLAGGIAHDFNNVLAAINGYTELAKWEMEENPVAAGYLASVLQGTKRAGDLVRQILAFSRRQELERKPLQLRVAIEDALKLLRSTIPTTIEFEVSLASDLPHVLADSTQVHQIVMNLCTNAAHAMRDRAGRLTINLETVEVEPELVDRLPNLRVGRYVRLSVTDTGHGMDEATQSRIFEPFFTTKGPGEGTGLGLAVVYGIMQSHEGAISVYSRLGEGTTFHLYFPAYVGAKSEIAHEISAIPRGQGQRVLYVDDEELIAVMGQKILERLGYVVEARTSAAAALAAIRLEPNAYALVFTDQTMPGMTGIALAAKIRALRPDLPIILTTGYSASLTNESVQRMGIRKLLLKPLTVEALASAAHAALNNPD